MHGVVATLETAVVEGHGARARRALGDVTDAGAADDAGGGSSATGSRGDDGAREQALDVLGRHAAAGSELATELLVEALDQFGAARRAVRRFLLDESAVDDVLQDTLITVARSITSFRGDAKLTTWLHQLARNRAVDHLRRARAVEPLDEHDASATERLSSLVASRQAVRQLLDELPDHYRTAVLLRDVEHLPYAEIAARLGVNLNTVKSHVARGRAVLAGLVERRRDP
jgi:RNA polymerase sigma-70 factor, ECF subfamily